MTRHRSRLLEDVAFAVSILVAVGYITVEAVVRLGLAPHATANPLPLLPFVIVILAFALPKVLGRATTGRIWEAFIQKDPSE